MKDREKEIAFSKSRRRLQADIVAFVEGYEKEIGVELIEQCCGLAGTLDPSTLEGHDIAIDYQFRDPQASEHVEVIGIRIRHENWQPKITIWGRKSMMRSFMSDNLTDEIKNYIRDCIDKTITQV